MFAMNQDIELLMRDLKILPFNKEIKELTVTSVWIRCVDLYYLSLKDAITA